MQTIQIKKKALYYDISEYAFKYRNIGYLVKMLFEQRFELTDAADLVVYSTRGEQMARSL